VDRKVHVRSLLLVGANDTSLDALTGVELFGLHAFMMSQIWIR